MKKTVMIMAILLSIFFTFDNYAQQKDFPVLKGPYLGQTPPGDTPVLFPAL